MVRKIIFTVVFFCACVIYAQEKKAFIDGERLKFKMSYSGFLKAGEAELILKEENLNGKQVYHATGIGTSSSIISWFFKIKDNYQSYFDVETGLPYLFKRKVSEGDYKLERDLAFNQEKNEVEVHDILKKRHKTVSVNSTVQDMISTFYYLRKYDTEHMVPGDEIDVNMFFDYESFPFKLKFLGYETLTTKFGKVKTQKFSPLVKAGRVFKEKESVAVWITADENKIPLKIQADLAVGSLRAELKEYKGLANAFDSVLD